MGNVVFTAHSTVKKLLKKLFQQMASTEADSICKSLLKINLPMEKINEVITSGTRLLHTIGWLTAAVAQTTQNT